MQTSIPVEIIEKKILLIRGERVMLDADLAELYGVKTFNLNKAVKRNIDRFPEDFMFQLSKEEADSLRFRIGMSKEAGRGGRRYLPYVFKVVLRENSFKACLWGFTPYLSYLSC
jgi:hypothetical protein